MIRKIRERRSLAVVYLCAVLILLPGCAAPEPDRDALQEGQPAGIDSQIPPEDVNENAGASATAGGEGAEPAASTAGGEGAEPAVSTTGGEGAEPAASTADGTGFFEEDTASGVKDGAVITEEILKQCREEFYRWARFEGAPSQEEMDILYQRFLDSEVMEREGMCLTGMMTGDYDGNGCTDMVVCLYSLEEDANGYRDGCFYLFMNEEEPYRIYEEFCCYALGMINDAFGADVDGDGRTEIVIMVQGTGNGGAGDTCKTIVKYLAPGIQQMELPSNLGGDYDRGIEVSVKGDPKKGVYIAYCSEFDEEIEFHSERELDARRDQRGGNCRGYYDLRMGEYQGEEVLLGYEYLFAGSIVEYVGDAVFVIQWDEEGNPYIRDWYVEGAD